MYIPDFLKNKNILIIAISVVIVFLLLLSSSFFHVLNKSIQNNYYAIKNTITGLHANPHIIIVDIDEKSFEEIGTFPFPRSVYAQVLNNLKEYDEAVIAFDLLFLDPSTSDSDDAFIAALQDTPNVVLWSAINNEWEVQLPYSKIPQDTYDTGFLPPNIDRSNRTVYSFSPLFTSQTGEVYEHFSLRILRQFYSYLYRDPDLLDMGEYNESSYSFSSDTSFSLAQSWGKDILINFIPGSEFTRISFSDLYFPERLKKIEKEIWFTDNIILIGPAAEGLKDEFFTPNGVEYGVNIHANILNTFLSRQFMMYFDKHLEWLLIFFLIVLSVFVNLSSSVRILLLGNIFIILIFWFTIPLSVLLGTNLIFNYPSEMIFSLVLAFSSANIVKYLIEDANKTKLNTALSEYVSSNIAAEILDWDGKINLDGEKRKLGCFFSDIEGFTTLSEKLTPEELVSFLREYLSQMTKIIMQEKGHVDKFEGDAIMAIWWAFHEYDKKKDSIKLCKSALSQQKALWALNVSWKEKLGWEVHVRMGIHSWEAIVWNIGAIGQKMEFTALWDDVNIASRLEWVNKYYGTHICVSESVYTDVQKQFRFRFLDTIQVKGKEESIKVYELLGEKDMYLSDEQETTYKEFADGLDLYLLQNFLWAKEKFSKLSELWDSPSTTFVKRCQYYIENPPWDDWTWVWRMTEK